MIGAHRFHADTRFTVGIETRHVAQHQPQLLRRFKALHHLLIQLIGILKEVIHRAGLIAGRHQRLDAHLIGFDVIARFTREDHQLAHHVLAGEIDARIGFRQALLPRLIHQFGKRHGAVKLQKQPGERSGENAADRQNAVAAFAQVAHGVINRQPGTDGGVIQPVTPGFSEGITDLAIAAAGCRPRHFVRANHVETVAGEIEVLRGEGFAGGHIQHHQVIKRVLAHPQEQRLLILFNRFILEKRQRPAGIQTVIAQQAAAAVHHPGQDIFKTGARGNGLLFACEQLQPA